MESFIFSSFMHDSFAKVTTLIKKKKKCIMIMHNKCTLMPAGVTGNVWSQRRAHENRNGECQDLTAQCT